MAEASLIFVAIAWAAFIWLILDANRRHREAVDLLRRGGKEERHG